MFVEYDNESALNEDKLAQLYDKIDNMPPHCSLFEWLMYDNTELGTRYEVMRGESLKITVLEGSERRGITRPTSIGPNYIAATWIDPDLIRANWTDSNVRRPIRTNSNTMRLMRTNSDIIRPMWIDPER
jgi:hypothetical protein